MSDKEIKYEPGKSYVCEHGRVRRQCADCEVVELYAQIDSQQQLIESQNKEIERQQEAMRDAIDLIGRMRDDYPGEMWTYQERRDWEKSASDQIYEIGKVLSGGWPFGTLEHQSWKAHV